MVSSWLVLLVSALCVGLLFAIARWGDARAARGVGLKPQPLVYTLALGVYCTSWTIYGAVERGSLLGWGFMATYLGPILVFVFGITFLQRLVTLARRRNITSLADFIAARYGRHRAVAAGVTVIALLSVLPYIALQIRSIVVGYEMLVAPGSKAVMQDSAALIAVLLMVFTILFGTRRVAANENHHGLMLAIAFESVIKLVAFAALGLWVMFTFYDGPASAYSAAWQLPQVSEALKAPSWQGNFAVQTLLGAAAILCLPRQFHVMVVENRGPKELAVARWGFPLYILLFAVFVLPIAAMGMQLLPTTAPDTLTLALPLSQGQPMLALVVYVGGFSAAISMVIVETLALSTMLCNELALPALLSMRKLGLASRADIGARIKTIRRIAIVLIISAAYGYYALFGHDGSLTLIGLLSFAAVTQFVPALVGGLLWRGGTHRGALAGVVGGFITWMYCLLLPAMLPDARLVSEGPFGLAWLKPQALFGFENLDPLSHGALMCFTVNVGLYVLVSLLRAPGLNERLQAAVFLDADANWLRGKDTTRLAATVGDVQALLERFFDKAAAAQVLESGQPGCLTHLQERITPELARRAELALAGALGASSARLLLASTLQGREMPAEDVISLLDDTSHAIVFSQERLRATLEHLAQGVTMVDKNLRLVAWNRRTLDLFSYPEHLMRIGEPIENLLRYNADRGLLGPGSAEQLVARRLQHLMRGTAYVHQRQLPDGTVIEIRGNPIPGGGFVTSYADVTAYTEATQGLREANDTLEARVAQRTAELADAKAEAERANEAKTRFLAAASHDLVQPLHAARLFLAAADRETLPAESAAVFDRVGDSLAAAEQLLSGLLDISKLDAGALPVHREVFAADTVLAPLAREFAALAVLRGLQFRYRGSKALLHSDPALLRRVLQNFLGNALRYTRQGRVLLGVRRERQHLRIEVWDTGPGIPRDQQRVIFEEFRRLQAQDVGGERGLGLGLAISERIARLLGHELTLRSVPGRGSVFALSVPLGAASEQPARTVSEGERLETRVKERSVRVLALDNEPFALGALTALLQRWGHTVLPAGNAREALAFCAQEPAPDVLLVDYHLDDGDSGIAVATQLIAAWQQAIPCIVITADHTSAARDAATTEGFALLQKPLKPAALRALMQRLLMD